MPTVKDKVTGDVVSRQPYTAEGTQRAEQIAESDQNWEIDHVPTQDGAARNVTEYAGGGNTGYAQIGQEYKEGGRTSNPYSKNIPGGLEKQRARHERIAKANEDAAKRSKKKRDDRRQARKERRAARPKLKKSEKKVKTPEMKIPGEQVKWAGKSKKAAKPKVKVSGKSGQEKRNVKKINKLALEKGQDKVKVAKDYDPTKGKPTGRIRKGVKEVTLTEGGAYAAYDKKSKPAGKFRKAFSKAKKAGKKTFKWDGRSYTTKTK